MDPITPQDKNLASFPFLHFELEDWALARSIAESNEAVIYTWKTEGYSNWLERGFSIVDTLGLLLVPCGYPDDFDIQDDLPEPGDLCEV